VGRWGFAVGAGGRVSAGPARGDPGGQHEARDR